MVKHEKDKKPKLVESDLPPKWDHDTLLAVGYKYDPKSGFYYRDFEFRFKEKKKWQMQSISGSNLIVG